MRKGGYLGEAQLHEDVVLLVPLLQPLEVRVQVLASCAHTRRALGHAFGGSRLKYHSPCQLRTYAHDVMDQGDGDLGFSRVHGLVRGAFKAIILALHARTVGVSSCVHKQRTSATALRWVLKDSSAFLNVPVFAWFVRAPHGCGNWSKNSWGRAKGDSR